MKDNKLMDKEKTIKDQAKVIKELWPNAPRAAAGTAKPVGAGKLNPPASNLNPALRRPIRCVAPLVTKPNHASVKPFVTINSLASAT